MTIAIEPVPAPTAEAAALVDELNAALGAPYPPHQRHGLALDGLFAPGIRFFIAQLDGAAMGCGAVALFDGYAELKRMYVRPAARGRGLAMTLLSPLWAEARAAGKPVLRLETGVHQEAAIGLYRAAGFRPCAAFGPYAGMPAANIETSLFFEKDA